MMTKKQRKFYEVLKVMVTTKGYFPTIREIGKKMGLSSPATVHAYLNRLFEKGYLDKKGNSWEIFFEYPSVPLMGIVPAGSPLEIFESLGEEVDLPEWMRKKEAISWLSEFREKA